MTVDDICAEAMALPNESKTDIVGRLPADLAAHPDPDVERECIAPATRRRDDVRSGAVQPVAGEEALARVRGILQR